MKTYNVFYYIKVNRLEIMKNMDIEACSSKEACAKCKEIVKEKTGRNAFRPTTKTPDASTIDFYKTKAGYACEITTR